VGGITKQRKHPWRRNCEKHLQHLGQKKEIKEQQQKMQESVAGTSTQQMK